MPKYGLGFLGSTAKGSWGGGQGQVCYLEQGPMKPVWDNGKNLLRRVKYESSVKAPNINIGYKYLYGGTLSLEPGFALNVVK